MATRGRPKKYDNEFKAELLEKFESYIDKTDIPIVKEFCYVNNVLSQRLYEFPEFQDTIKRCIDKKEAQLERKCLNGEIDKTMAVFSLKQLGWKDKQETEITDIPEIKISVRNNNRSEKDN